MQLNLCFSVKIKNKKNQSVAHRNFLIFCLLCYLFPGAKKKDAAPDIVDDGLDVVDVDFDSLAGLGSATQSVKPAPAPIVTPAPTVTPGPNLTPATIPSDAPVGAAAAASKFSTTRVPPDDVSADAYKAAPSKIPPTSAAAAATSAANPGVPPEGASAAAAPFALAASSSGATS